MYFVSVQKIDRYIITRCHIFVTSNQAVILCILHYAEIYFDRSVQNNEEKILWPFVIASFNFEKSQTFVTERKIDVKNYIKESFHKIFTSVM